MKFGRLENIEGVDFRFPTIPAPLFNGDAAPNPGKIYSGATGWGMKDWKGKIYPEKCKPTEYLRHYSRAFNTVELNTTHYRIPSSDQIKKWGEQVPESFRFCPKVFKGISHSKDFGLDSGHLVSFIDSLKFFEGNLGLTFMQLPNYFDISRAGTLKSFLDEWPPEFKLAIEFRHPSIFEQTTALKIAKALALRNVSWLITDVAGRRDVCHMYQTAKHMAIRFVGNNLHPTDFERLDLWGQQLTKWHNDGIEDCYFFIHEPDNVLAIEALKHFMG